MNDLQVFKNEQFGEVRTIVKDGEPWFVGKDVAEILGYSNGRDAIVKHVDEDDKNTVAFRDGTTGNPNQVIINESGLYSLILSSKLPTAKKFKRWVTSDILPAIRKHGAYMTPDTLKAAMQDPDTLITILKQLKTEQEQRKVLEAKVEQDAPKVLFADSVSASKQSILVGELAKLLRQNGVKIGQNRLFEQLRNEGYLCKYGQRYNKPTQYAAELGLFEIKETVIANADGSTRIVSTTKVTGKGQLYFINKYLSGVNKTNE